jgi:hypothetical protein
MSKGSGESGFPTRHQKRGIGMSGGALSQNANSVSDRAAERPAAKAEQRDEVAASCMSGKEHCEG